jgi:hypothetical protein
MAQNDGFLGPRFRRVFGTCADQLFHDLGDDSEKLVGEADQVDHLARVTSACV